MEVALLFVILAALTVIGLLGITTISLLLGGMLIGPSGTRALAPVFLVVLPSASLGALLGGIVIGRHVALADDRSILHGPLVGLLIGGAIGLFVGVVGALFLWWRISNHPHVDP